jgi:tripartite-type tricarboxylate transporter receptor subunit TctC
MIMKAFATEGTEGTEITERINCNVRYPTQCRIHPDRFFSVPSVSSVAIALSFSLASPLTCAQPYPSKPIRVIAPEAGGGVDFVARVIAREMSLGMGQQVVIDNRGGAGGIIAGETVVKSAPDGHTLLFWGPAMFLLPYLRERVPFDTLKDLAPVSLAVTTPNVMVVHPSLPVSTVRELIALAKEKPAQLNDAGANTGSSAHLTAELFKAMAGVNIVRVPFKGVGPALNALIAGQVQLMFPSAGSITQHVKSGRLRALAVTSAKPSALTPGLPTVAESGVPGYESVAVFGVFAPAQTPAEIIARVQREIARATGNPDVRKRFLDAGVEPVGSTPDEYASTIRREAAKWGKLIRDLGIRED